MPQFLDGNRRRQRRWEARGSLGAHVRGIPKASVVDISLAGVLVEHAETIRPGTISFVTLSLQGQRGVLKCRVIRSVGHRYEVCPTGGRDILYRTGLEFLTPSEASLGLIDKSIDFVNHNPRPAILPITKKQRRSSCACPAAPAPEPAIGVGRAQDKKYLTKANRCIYSQ